MKSNVLLASLITAISLQSGALAQAAPEPAGDNKPAEAASAAPAAAEPSIVAPEQKARPKKRQTAAPAPAPEPSGTSTFSNFFRGNASNAPAQSNSRNSARTASANPQSQDVSQFMLRRAASSYSTSSNALGFGLYRVTPRETVAFKERHAPGTILVRQREKRLYYVNGDGTAIRYAIAVGREGAAWAGTSAVSDKREWPDWTPTANILAKQPDLPRHVEGGPANPMGARALYLGQTMYRIHGTNEPWRIGEEASSGCIRLTNDDIVDLYNRTRLGATVIVTR
ncbi:MAG TPA: L,D-transpeptidase [Pseudorhodoplanes sp.]|nr:L,D-transpeptidase [Pseudorhodoplanes sp.]